MLEYELVEVARFEHEFATSVFYEARPIVPLTAEQYPSLARIWDNPEDDEAFKDM